MKSASLLIGARVPGDPPAGYERPLDIEWAKDDAGTVGRPLESPKNPGEKPVFGNPFISFLILAAPAVLAGILVFLYGVDTPWGDQWDGTWPLLEKVQKGTLGLADFFAFHNEHRIVFPRLIALGLGQLTHWNVRAELLVIWILTCLCSLTLWRVTLIAGWRNSSNRGWLLLATNVMLFAPLHWENFLWGFQIGFLLPLVTTTAAFWAAISLQRPFNFLATMALCFISTFSIASGFASWFVTAPLLLLTNKKTSPRAVKVWWLLWLLVGAASVFLYFRGYTRPAVHPSVLEALRHPLLAIQFTLAYLGTPFSSGTALDGSVVASVAGAALVVLFLACLFYLWRCRRDRTLLVHSMPWISLAGWALINAFLTMLGRVGFGISAATQSRYACFAIMLPIGLLFLGSLVVRHWRERSGMKTVGLNRGFVVLATALSLLFVLSAIKSLESWERFEHNSLSGKAAVLLVNVLDEPDFLARHVHQGDPALKARINFLDSQGYLRPPLLRSNRIRDIAFRAGETETLGEVNEFGGGSGVEYTASGWAVLPQSHRTADAVLLTYDNAQGEPIIFALADVTSKRLDVSRKLGDKTYLYCGWTKSWKTEQIPKDSRWIRAWTFDAENCRAFAIGAASLEPAKAAP